MSIGSNLFATDGSVIPNIPLGIYRVQLEHDLEYQEVLRATVEFCAEPGSERKVARRLARSFARMHVTDVTCVRRPGSRP